METEIMVALISAIVGPVLVALISFYGNRAGARKAASENAQLIAYRLEQLEEKVNAHNHLVERVTKVEGRMTEAEHDIRDLKGGKSA